MKDKLLETVSTDFRKIELADPLEGANDIKLPQGL